MGKLLLYITLFSLPLSAIHAQDTIGYQHRLLDGTTMISFDATVGTALFFSYIGGGLEVVNRRIGNKMRSTTRVGVGHIFGHLSFDGSETQGGWNIYLGQTFLIGSKNKFVELGTGLNLLFWQEIRGGKRIGAKLRPLPGFNIGHRFQNKDRKFRIGVGFPELLYIGIGLQRSKKAKDSMKRIRT